MRTDEVTAWVSHSLEGVQKVCPVSASVSLLINPFSDTSTWLTAIPAPDLSVDTVEWIREHLALPVAAPTDTLSSLAAPEYLLHDDGKSVLIPMWLNQRCWGTLLVVCNDDAFIQDTEGRVISQQALLLSYDLERRIQAQVLSLRERVSRWLAHEVRNPLTGLIGLASLLHMDLEMNGTLPLSDMRELTTMVSEQGQRIVGLLNDEKGGLPNAQAVADRSTPVTATAFLSSLVRLLHFNGSSADVSLPKAVDFDLSLDIEALTSAFGRWVALLGLTLETAPVRVASKIESVIDKYWVPATPMARLSLTISGISLRSEEVTAVNRWVDPEASGDVAVEVATRRLRGLTLAHNGWLVVECTRGELALEFVLPLASPQ